MPPSSKAPWPTRHSMPYFTSLLTILTPSSQSFSGFTQPFAPFSLGPPGAQQVPLTPSGLPLLRNLPPSSSLNGTSSRHENSPFTFYTSRDSTMPSPSSHLPLSMLFSLLLFFCSWKVNDCLSMQITPFLLASPESIRQHYLPHLQQLPCSQCQPKFAH